MIEKLKEKFMNKQFLTYGIIGVINTLNSQLLYMLFVKLGTEVGMSSILGDLISMVGSYFMNTYITYKQKPTWKSAVTFPISYIPGTIISALVTMIVVNVFHGPKMWAKLIALPIYFPINYLCMTFIMKTFGKTEEKN
ncbi:MAG: GtrA family protein [Solobacterium sp.]|nr:GtrA family protein [Solobacterium sp.]